VRAAKRERHTPISDLHWLISTTAMTVGISVKGDTAPVQVVPADTPSVSCSDDASHLLAARPTASRIGWYDDENERRKGPTQCDPLDEKASALIPAAGTVSSFGDLSSHPSGKFAASLGWSDRSFILSENARSVSGTTPSINSQGPGFCWRLTVRERVGRHNTHNHIVLCAVAVRVLLPNWLESQHMLAPARHSKSSESATQERE
jgi:hypothetical protein